MVPPHYHSAYAPEALDLTYSSSPDSNLNSMFLVVGSDPLHPNSEVALLANRITASEKGKQEVLPQLRSVLVKPPGSSSCLSYREAAVGGRRCPWNMFPCASTVIHCTYLEIQSNCISTLCYKTSM